MLHKWWDAASWHQEDLGGNLKSPPYCVTSSQGNIHCFALSSAGTLAHKWWDTASWHEDDLGGALAGSPYCVASRPGELHCFGLSASGTMLHKWWNPPKPPPPATAAAVAAPRAVPQDHKSIDCGLIGPHYAEISCPASTSHANCWCAVQSFWGNAKCQCDANPPQPPNPPNLITKLGEPGRTSLGSSTVGNMETFHIAGATKIEVDMYMLMASIPCGSWVLQGPGSFSQVLGGNVFGCAPFPGQVGYLSAAAIAGTIPVGVTATHP